MIHQREYFIIPAVLADVPGIMAGFTTRKGGVSTGPFQSLNLGLSTGDDSALVIENRRRMAEAAGLSVNDLAIAGQVHGDRVRVVDAPGLYPGFDALVTSSEDVVLCATAADCAVILLANPQAGVIAACHAGWRGTEYGIVLNTVRAMEELGAGPATTRAYVGPSICVDEFEVGEEVAARFADKYVVRRKEWRKPHVDVKAAIADQLAAKGVASYEVSNRCTFTETEDFFSYRAESGVTGRMMGFICRTTRAGGD